MECDAIGRHWDSAVAVHLARARAGEAAARVFARPAQALRESPAGGTNYPAPMGSCEKRLLRKTADEAFSTAGRLMCSFQLSVPTDQHAAHDAACGADPAFARLDPRVGRRIKRFAGFT